MIQGKFFPSGYVTMDARQVGQSAVNYDYSRRRCGPRPNLACSQSHPG